MNDAQIEGMIIKKGLINNRVTLDDINKIVADLKYHSWVVPSTTTTVVVAELDGFVLGIGTSACVDSNNFDYEIGFNIAQANAKGDATDRLWEIKGWQLWNSVNAP